MKFMFFSIKYHYSDILWKRNKLHLSRLFCCNHTCYVNMVSVMSAMSASRYISSTSRHHPRYQSRSSMYILGLIPRNFAELAEAVPIAYLHRVKNTALNWSPPCLWWQILNVQKSRNFEILISQSCHSEIKNRQISMKKFSGGKHL